MPGTVILDMPFDDTEFSPVAYDYSPGAHHADVTDGTFLPGKFGNCLFFPEEGLAEIKPLFIDFSQDFTYMVWVICHIYGNNSVNTKAGFCFGNGTEQVVSLNVDLSSWTHIAITKNGNLLNVIKNGTLVKTFIQPASPLIGFAVVNSLPHSTGGWCSFDDGKIIQGEALPPDEIGEEINNQTIINVNFSINGTLLSDYGIGIDSVPALFGRPAKKEGIKVDWEDEHGEVYVTGAQDIYQAKNIVLGGWLRGTSLDDFFSKWYAFVDAISSNGTVRLQLDVGTKKIVSEVRLEDDFEFDKDKFVEGENFCRFKLNLVEPQPVKRVLKANSTCTITIASTGNRKYSIYWGDGGWSMNCDNGTYTHNYSDSADKYVIVTGRLDKLTTFTHNAVIHWNYLV